MITVSATEARNNFSELLNKVAYSGERVLVKRRGKPLVFVLGVPGKMENPKYSDKSGQVSTVEDKEALVEQLSGGLSTSMSGDLTSGKINKLLDQRYDEMLP